MITSLVLSFLLFALTALGLAWPVVARLALEPAEKITASVVLSMLGIFLFAWGIYVTSAPPALLWALPAAGMLGPIVFRREWAATLRAPDVRRLLAGQALITAWCLGWLALVTSYSGGGWAGDWLEHFQRTFFFLRRWPTDFLFIGTYSLTARPPLVNVNTAAFLALTRGYFANHQVVMTAFGSLAFMPVALLARRFGPGPRVIALAAALLMVNPLFVQNATFAWTKLPTAFFILTSLYFFLRVLDPAPPTCAAPLFAAALSAGLLAHYSAGPYALLLVAAWLAHGRRRLAQITWWRSTARAAAAGAPGLIAWFGWAFYVYGLRGTLFANTTVTDRAASFPEQATRIALNLRDTLVPPFLRTADPAILAQRSPWGWWRDQFFQTYQLNLFYAFGSVAGFVLLAQLAEVRRQTPRGRRDFWTVFIVGAVIIGVAVHGARDQRGLVHICLQPIVLLGLAFLAARWRQLSRFWRLALVGGGVLDFIFGVLFHFLVQNYAFDRWLASGRPPADWPTNYTLAALYNFRAKVQPDLVFFADLFGASAAGPLVLLTAILALALSRLRRHPRTP